MDVLLEDQPSGCLANLNSSYQNKVVGRALLNMTQLNSGEPPDRNVICVAMIEDYFNDFLWSCFDGNVRFQCCEMSKEETTESASIQCELDVHVSGWFKAFNGTLYLLTLLMMLYCPAFLLFLPDSIFNLQEECKKEERRENDNYHRQSSPQRSRYGSTDEALVNVNAENSDSVPLVTLVIPTQSQQAYSQSLLYLDEPNPITFSYFLRNYTKERTGGCLVGGLSCRCITRMFSLVTLGLVLNASVIGPFLALSIVALTNIYLCYYNLKMRYRDVKEMISEK